MQTDSAGNLVETWSYYPFGEQWEQSGSGGNEHRYTGHRRDPETGNDYAGARYLNGSKGRWLAVDPDRREFENPQGLNLYGYVRNEPLDLVDPDGELPQFPRAPGGQGREETNCLTYLPVPSEPIGGTNQPRTVCFTHTEPISQVAMVISGHTEVQTERENSGGVRGLLRTIRATVKAVPSALRSQLSDFLNNGIGKGCSDFFAGDLDGLRKKVNSLDFWDTKSSIIADLPIYQVGRPESATLAEAVGDNYAITVNGNIVLGSRFWDLAPHMNPSTLDQDSILFHELLHATNPELSDTELAFHLGIGSASDSLESAGQKITIFLSNDCVWEN